MSYHERAMLAAKWHARRPWPHAAYTCRWAAMQFESCK
jgi:hypothetical protein